MWVAELNRRRLVDVLEDREIGDLELRRTSKLEPVSGDLAGIYWGVSPKKHFEWPAAIVVQDEWLTDFLAWSSTYVGGARPLSAFCRVISSSDAALSQGAAGFPGLGAAQNACIGLVLGELRMLAGPGSDRVRLSFLAHRATHAFAIARGIAVYGAAFPAARVSEAWRQTRRRSDASGRIAEPLLAPWAAIAGLLPKGIPLDAPVDPGIRTACQEVSRRGEVSGSTWERLTEGHDWLRHAHRDTAGSRESRVAYVERALDALRGVRPSLATAFIGAYLLSRVSPGSFDHAHLVMPSALYQTLPWYGLLAGLHGKFVLADQGPLRHLLLRELQRKVSLDDYPDCDSNFEEYRMTGRVASEDSKHHASSIEVLPGVSVIVQPVSHAPRGESSSGGTGTTVQQDLFDQRRADSDSPPRRR